MSLAHRLGQRVADPGTDPHQGSLLDPDPHGDLVRGQKSDPTDIPRQTIRVVADHPHGFAAIGLVDPYRPRGTDPIGVQEQHDLTHDLLFRPAGNDPGRTFGANTGDLTQAVRLLLDEIEHRLAKTPHQPLGVDPTDAADHARPEIPFDALKRCRRAGLQEGRAELLAVRAVVYPCAAHLHELAGADQRSTADDGHEVPLAPRLDPKYAEPVLRVMVRHPFHEACQGFTRCCLGDIRHVFRPFPRIGFVGSPYRRHD
jgi:hypothetical protein